MAATANVLSSDSTLTFTFQSEAHLQKALAPHNAKDIEQFSAESTTAPSLVFECDASSSDSNIVPVRNSVARNLLKYEVFQGNTLAVCYPETPRVPHHLAIVLNRERIRGITDVSVEENEELFRAIRTIAEIYKTISIQGFVIAQFDAPQEGHLGRYVVEIIPHLPGFQEVKNFVDKVFCNLHILFRTANLSQSTVDETDSQSATEHVLFWQRAFQDPTTPLSAEDLSYELPYTRFDSHQEEAQVILRRHLIESLQDRGALTSEEPPTDKIEMPYRVPENITPAEITKCFFCDDKIIRKQLVYEYESVLVFYNIRKSAKPECAFLILPKRHIEKVYTLSEKEIRDIHIVRKALVEVLREAHPDHEVMIYIQDAPSVGQTVFHSHEQVVSIDPKTISLSWTLSSLYPGRVSDEEMRETCEKFGPLLEQKIKKPPFQKSA